MKMYNALIIGAGGQGSEADQPESGNEHKIISFVHAFKEHPGFSDIKIYDSNPEKAIKAAKIWGLSATTLMHTHLYNGTVDLAAVTTPDDTHYEILKQLAEYPLKLVICEKPICTDLQQAREIVKLYKTKEIPLMVNYTRRVLPYYEDLKSRYESGEFGKIVFANIVFNRGFIHTGTHAIDFCEWFFNGQYNGRIMECETDYRIWQIDLYFEKYHWREERIGDMPVWDYCNKQTWHVVDNAYNFLEGREPLKCSGEDGLKALKICFGLMEGAKT